MPSITNDNLKNVILLGIYKTTYELLTIILKIRNLKMKYLRLAFAVGHAKCNFRCKVIVTSFVTTCTGANVIKLFTSEIYRFS